MSSSWEARWGTGFKSEKEMIRFFSSLDDEDSKASAVPQKSPAEKGGKGALAPYKTLPTEKKRKGP